MVSRYWKKTAGAAALTLLALLAGCDQQRIAELEEGTSTEADVRARFGEPDRVWDEPGGARTFEYNRQPAGHQNYMITIGPDGRMAALRQVLAPHQFAQIVPGMPQEEVRRRLGQPMKQTTYERKGETDWDWRWNDGGTQPMVFTATFDAQGRVLRSGSTVEMRDGR
ncbi:outer membrane protein assembly factor BamE [Paracidovorax wautersii]|uniref:Outer membrane protein assembly factor BamE (Lipoprotein component of BamABCDE complex) n=1 Tax=Paracidovorax wautersii TaxID=1177982 RepID=A0ABU1I8B5_9BURK|nr:outer membrane protein assembly factor BamE [Paracidovorax wautersii]MDR6212638.1 outer membrane protein assembly factor BamE (lipoprotein component of BamABCDE complex) [Paracidovorax wautersii]